MEIINPNIPRGKIRVAIFDFDGTLSLLREGWMRLMHALMLEALIQTPRREDEATLRQFITDLIYQTSGQQTIYQMIRLTQEIEKRGGIPDTAQTYLSRLTSQLHTLVHARESAITTGAAQAQDWLVPGTMQILESLRARNVTCYIASGTAEEFVRAETALLGIAPFFTDIFGAHADYKNHSKKIVIGNLVAKHALTPGEWITFGDGMPEIADTKTFGGIAVGVATNEESRNGVNEQKRAVLVQAGADMIISNFCRSTELIEYLFCANPQR